MFYCYLDESGCTGALPNATSEIQPVLVVGGLVLTQDHLRQFTQDFLALKQRYFPNLLPRNAQYLDWILKEVKGSDLRRDIRSGNRNERRHAIGFMERIIDLVERHHARLIGRIWVKGIGHPFNGTATYTYSVQSICQYFQKFLAWQNSTGIMIADSRDKVRNARVSHSIFTQKFRAAGDGYDRILEMPVFGHSDNHAGIQVADLICSAMLFPMATFAYCYGHVQSTHVNIRFSQIRDRLGSRLEHLQYRYQEQSGKWTGGITVSDAISQTHGSALFRA